MAENALMARKRHPVDAAADVIDRLFELHHTLKKLGASVGLYPFSFTYHLWLNLKHTSSLKKTTLYLIVDATGGWNYTTQPQPPQLLQGFTERHRTTKPFYY